MPFVSLNTSSLLPDVSPVQIYYREAGIGPPLILLHGGWGYDMYPFDRQVKQLAQDHRCLSPDRSGYGRSMKLAGELPKEFHSHAAIETLNFMDALGIERANFWGHSDGAVIAAILGFTAPERVSGLILEAFHYYALKLSSREFFGALASEPETLGTELCERFARDFGADYWRHLITTHANAWIQLARAANQPDDDLYEGRLKEIEAPTLFIHGRLDPRTEPGELDAVRSQMPGAWMEVLDLSAHSPHSEAAVANQVTELAEGFLSKSQHRTP
ncbi:MAG TPA: alpha/beta hydrolase [Pyrinomonadaceae bacterium]|nr:alpha/beta hydrolase [Pyrinomonadaceae bacterium]